MIQSSPRVAAVPGSVLRKTLFWAHLGSGIAAGLIILILSVTGALLAYEKQFIAGADHGNRVVAVAGQTQLSVECLAEQARRLLPDARRLSLVFDVDPLLPVAASSGRGVSLLLNPYSGAAVVDAAAQTRAFFRSVENWHRWLAGSGTSVRARAVDAANLLFLFMTVSGVYLWFPAALRWRTLRGLMFLRSRYVNARVRDFSWHHVFGFWAVLPLFVIALSGVVMSYPWANSLVYAAFGETAPSRQQGAPQGAGASRDARPSQVGATAASLDTLLATAKTTIKDWQKLTLPVSARGERVEITAEMRSRLPRSPRRTLVLASGDARVLSLSEPDNPGSRSPGQRARTWLRFAHTGEQFGIIGQTIAALASLATCLLVYSGFALAFRRLLVPLWRRRT